LTTPIDCRAVLLRAITDCGHSIKHSEVRLFVDGTKPGNALGQLATRVEAAHKELMADLLAAANRLTATVTEFTETELCEIANNPDSDGESREEAAALLQLRAAVRASTPATQGV
jgi:hypothetical protein